MLIQRDTKRCSNTEDAVTNCLATAPGRALGIFREDMTIERWQGLFVTPPNIQSETKQGLGPQLCSESQGWCLHFQNLAGPMIISIILFCKPFLLCPWPFYASSALNAHLRLSFSDTIWEPEILAPIPAFPRGCIYSLILLPMSTGKTHTCFLPYAKVT